MGLEKTIQWHFFYLRAAFMLLEVQVISKAALLFGTTWLVNSIVITMLLGFILLANLGISMFPKLPRGFAYIGLFGTLLLGYVIPTNKLFYHSALLRGGAATALLCAPVFLRVSYLSQASRRSASGQRRSGRISLVLSWGDSSNRSRT
jgi:hypothetical protein